MFLIKKLYVGQEFKSIQALSLFLTGAKIPPGNQYTNTINKFKKHFSWENIPHTRKIIITEIYDQPKVTISKSKYTSQIISNMTLLNPDQYYTKQELYPLLGFTNESFVKLDQYTVNINKLHYSISKYDSVHNTINMVISQMFYTIINKLNAADYVEIKKSYRYYYKTNSEEIIPPEDFLNDLIPELLASYGYKNEYTAFRYGSENFRNDLKKELEVYNIKSYQRTYSIKFLNVPINLPEPSPTALQHLIAEKLKHYVDDPEVINTLILS